MIKTEEIEKYVVSVMREVNEEQCINFCNKVIKRKLQEHSTLNLLMSAMIAKLNRSISTKQFTKDTPYLIRNLEKSIETFKYRLSQRNINWEL